jgi:DNA processing protein
MSAISHCTAVIEAPIGSGALLTAHHAIKQGKKVYTVPGSVMQPTFEGNNYLIKEGIGAVLDVQDILQGLSVMFPDTQGIRKMQKEYFIPPELAKAVNDMSGGRTRKNTPTVSRADELDGIYREIYEKILKGDVHNAEELISDGMTLGKTLYVLTQLEAEGFINVIPGGGYTVKNT